MALDHSESPVHGIRPAIVDIKGEMSARQSSGVKAGAESGWQGDGAGKGEVKLEATAEGPRGIDEFLWGSLA